MRFTFVSPISTRPIKAEAMSAASRPFYPAVPPISLELTDARGNTVPGTDFREACQENVYTLSCPCIGHLKSVLV